MTCSLPGAPLKVAFTQRMRDITIKISFENRVALVTGAASGLGLATARAIAEAEGAVVLADWNEQEVQKAAKEFWPRSCS
jgi:hypothetical protein